MAESAVPKTKHQGTLTITPGSGSPYTCVVEMGNLTIEGLEAGQRAEILVTDRGMFHEVVEGDQTYPTVSFTVVQCDVVDGTDATLLGILTRKGPYAAATSTRGTGRPWCVDLLFTIAGTGVGDAANHTFTLEDYRPKVSFTEGDPNEYAVSGTVYGTITPT